MLAKWFKRKSAPNKDGDSSPDNIEKLQYVKVFELELSNMEDSPVYALTNQLTIGSEIGNIVIADPSVSPRHATFVLQDEVVSVTDHGSVAGTHVNGKKISPGKNIILEETDVVMVGDLEVRLKVGRTGKKVEEIPDAPEAAEDKEEEKKPKFKTSPKSSIKLPEKKKKQPVMAMSSVSSSTNAVIRVLSVFTDLILSYAILIVFMPFDEFRDLINVLPELISTHVSVDWDALLSSFGQDLGFLKDMLNDGMTIVSSSFPVVPLVLIFLFLRLIFTLLFGVSLSELLLGVRPVGNKLWARFGGALRVLIGMITWPFLIFDLPAIVSRRTFKEVITFTNTHVPSKFVAILGIIFYLPLTIAISVVAPLFQGLEIPEPVLVNDAIEQRVKVKVPQNGEAEVSPVSEKSGSLNVELTYNPSDLFIVPSFRFQGAQNKLTVTKSLVFYQRDLQRKVELEVFKTFDLKQLLGIGIKGNVFLYERYPEIYNYVYEPDEVNVAFKKTQDQKAQARFANEVISFTKSAFSLSLESLVDFMQTESPLISSYIEFRSSLLSLVEYKDFDQIGFMKIGNILFMKISYLKQKPFDLIIPLMKGQGRILKITFDNKENVGAVSSKFYKFNLEKTNWLPEGKKESGDVLTGLEVFDLFNGENYKTLLQSSSKAQAFYAYYYETSALVLKKGDPVEIDLWKSRVKNTLNLIEQLPPSETETGENPKEKLLQNLRDTSDALENNNKEYFGITATTSV